MTLMRSDTPSLSLAGATRRIRDGALSPVDLTEYCLAHVMSRDDELHAFTSVLIDQARRDAACAAREIAQGHWRGPLHGIPLAIKDTIDVGGVPTRAQSFVMDDYVPARHAAAVSKWVDAGAIVLGKLTTHEFAFGLPASDLTAPAARNPWDLARFAGGSSSGAAVATATDMVFGALGSDTAGSVRSPAALCGVAGFKPGRGRVDRQGSFALAPSLDALGVMARSVEDCAVLYDALLDADATRPRRDETGLIELDTDLGGLKIGVVRDFFKNPFPVADALTEAVEVACEALSTLGCRIRDVQLPSLDAWNAAGMIVLLCEAFALHAPWLGERLQQYGESFSDAVLPGALFDAADYLDARRANDALTASLADAMRTCDVLIAPIQPAEAPVLESLRQWGFLERPSYGIPFNVADHPALAIGCGMGPAGLPLALQMIGRRNDEWTVLRAGHAFQTITDWHRRRPPSG